jgi:hypothetical protein
VTPILAGPECPSMCLGGEASWSLCTTPHRLTCTSLQLCHGGVGHSVGREGYDGVRGQRVLV